MTCPHKFHWNTLDLTCTRDEGHDGDHTGRMLRTDIHWQSGDRRDYQGELTPCPFELCILPGGHNGRHAF